MCSVSQSVAAAAALRDAMAAEVAPNGILVTNPAHAAENAADHLMHFYILHAGLRSRGLCRACMTRHGTVSQRRAALRHAMSCRGGRGCSNPWVSSPGKWLHSVAF
ncbi:nickel-dependent hydrogenase large subunit [Bradyrhizobium sp. 173]|uniref:nickel-dependent hydrogenase large subunit n=1 Tax=Bradyrhizobium sp. 173 TaxID=2782644 RepID=UPI001FF91DCC